MVLDHSQLTHCPSYHFSRNPTKLVSWSLTSLFSTNMAISETRNPTKSFFQIHKAKVQLLFFNSKILLQQSYSKNGISGSFTYHNPNCICKMPNRTRAVTNLLLTVCTRSLYITMSVEWPRQYDDCLVKNELLCRPCWTNLKEQCVQHTTLDKQKEKL